MSKYVIDSSTLTSIADAVREKGGTTEAIVVSQIPDAILAIKSGTESDYPLITSDDLTLTGDLSYLNKNGRWSWLFNKYSDYITYNNVTSVDYMHQNATNLTKAKTIGLGINEFEGCTNLNSVSIDAQSSRFYCAFKNCKNLETVRPPYKNDTISILKKDGSNTVFDSRYMFANCNKLKDLSANPSSYTWKISAYSNTSSSNTFYLSYAFQNCYALKSIPEGLLAGICGLSSTSPIFQNSSSYAGETGSYTNAFDGCLSLRHLNVYCKDYYTTSSGGIRSSDLYSNAFNRLAMLNDIYFSSGSISSGGYVSSRNDFTIDLSDVGYCSNEADAAILTELYGNPVTIAEEYEAQKDTSDWWTTNPDYSRFNLTSFKKAITYLPRIKSGSATIKFKSGAGSGTDGGGIDPTQATTEIAYANQYGWTVTFA